MAYPFQKTQETIKTLEELRQIYVGSERDEWFQQHLNRNINGDPMGQGAAKPVAYTAGGESRGVLVLDGPGGGKTSLIHKALREHPDLQPMNEAHRPWLGVSVPSPATVKSLGWEILRVSGYPEVSERKSGWQVWKLIRARLKLLGTTVLWIDEAHDMFNGGIKKNEIEIMLKMLKTTMQGESAVVVVLSGIEDLGQIASFNDEVKRRFSHLKLPQVTMASNAEELSAVVEAYCETAGLTPQLDKDLIPRLIYASRGRFGRCIENLIHAIEIALLKGDSQLSRDHFAEAWVVQEGCEPGGNVFVSQKWSQINLTPRNQAA
jgi:hypothetical protein